MGLIDDLSKKYPDLIGDATHTDESLLADSSSVHDVGAPSRARQAGVERSGRTSYVVQAGDTLDSIADEVGIPVAQLCGMNGIVDPDAPNLYAGRALIVPE